MPPLLVEFSGLPGSGKTTLTRAVLPKLAAMGYSCFGLNALNTPEGIAKRKGGVLSKLSTFYRFTSSCIRHKHLALVALAFASHVAPYSLMTFRRIATLLLRLDFIETTMSDNYDLIVLDQGLIQNIWSIAVTGARPGDRYLAWLIESVMDGISPAILLVDVDVKLALERISNRPTMRSRFDTMSVGQAENLMAKHKDTFDRLMGCAVQFKGTRYFRLDGSLSIEKNVPLAVQFIEQCLANERPKRSTI